MELGAPNLRHVLESRPGQPVLVLREADTSEWTIWRKLESAREASMAREHRERLKVTGMSEAQFLQDRALVLAFNSKSDRLLAALEALALREEAGEDVTHERAKLTEEDDQESEARRVWGEAVDRMAAYRNAEGVEPHQDTLDTTRHSFELVLKCIVRLEGVTAGGGKPVVWADGALSEMGLTKERVLEQLLGPGISALNELYACVRKVTTGLTEDQKKA